MRAVLFLAAVVSASAAHAQMNSFYAERGYWLVASNGKTCRALNRPPADFNFAPYGALEIAVRSDNSMGVEVYFWPKAVGQARDYVLKLSFEPGDTLGLKAKPTMGDFMLASDPEQKLWRSFQDAAGLTVAVEGEPSLKLYFRPRRHDVGVEQDPVLRQLIAEGVTPTEHRKQRAPANWGLLK